MIQSISPSHGRALIYVWAVEQDDLSKRTIPTTAGNEDANSGQDVFVPWVLSNQTRPKERKTKGSQHPEQATKHTELAIAREEETHAHTQDEPQQTFNRYYHMFARGELTKLVHDAAEDLGLHVGPRGQQQAGSGIEIVQDGWERSNYYVELRRWVGTEAHAR